MSLTPQVQFTSSRDLGSNLFEENFRQEFNIIIPFPEREYNSIDLKIICYKSIDFSDDDSFKLIDDFLNCLSEEETEFHGIFYFTHGGNSRFLKHDKIFLRRIVINFGIDILRSLVIVQAYSNKIVPTQGEFEDKNDLQDKLNKLNEYKSKVSEYENKISNVQKNPENKKLLDQILKYEKNSISYENKIFKLQKEINVLKKNPSIKEYNKDIKKLENKLNKFNSKYITLQTKYTSSMAVNTAKLSRYSLLLKKVYNEFNLSKELNIKLANKYNTVNTELQECNQKSNDYENDAEKFKKIAAGCAILILILLIYLIFFN